MKDPTEELTGIYFSLWLWDISHALNMTSFLFYVILNDSEESHRITDGHILFTLVVGYFADAQYDNRDKGCYCVCSGILFYFVIFLLKKIISYLVKIVDNCKLNVLYSCK